MSDDDPVIAVGLLRRSDLERLGEAFTRWYPIDDTPRFGELLRAIDIADRWGAMPPPAPKVSPREVRMSRAVGEWSPGDRGRLLEMATRGVGVLEAARTLGRRQTDVVSEAGRLGFGMIKRSPRERWSLCLRE